MNNFFQLLLLVYLILTCGMIIGAFLQFHKEKKYNLKQIPTISLDELVVIIPFRDEEKRLLPLLESINQQTKLPLRFVFVDDHSTDGGQAIIRKLSASIPYEIISLSDSEEGKKRAIRKGIESSTSNYILTWDADIILPVDYFLTLSSLEEADMYILPVIMQGHSFFTTFFEADHAMANAVNTSTTSWFRPFIASGANLLFNRKAFTEADRISDHQHIASGDDVFLLRDFRNANKNIRLSSDNKLAVYTSTPTTWNEFFHQRLRWIGKSKNVSDPLSNSLALLSLTTQILFYGLCIYFAASQFWFKLMICWTLKSVLDLCAFAPYFLRMGQWLSWILLPIFSIIQPLYALIIGVLLLTKKPVWKGRF